MIVNPNQIRAARALLDWTVAQLGEKVGVGATMISAIETSRSSGSKDVLTAIIYAFQAAGVELTEDGGVRPRQNRIENYRGPEGFRAFFDEVYKTAKEHYNPKISITSNNEADYERWLGAAFDSMHMKRIAELKRENFRVLLRDQDTYLPCINYCDYKWVPSEQFADVSLYIYGDKVGFVEFTENDVRVTVVDNKAVTEAIRKMFDLAWDKALLRPNI